MRSQINDSFVRLRSSSGAVGDDPEQRGYTPACFRSTQGVSAGVGGTCAEEGAHGR